MADERHKVIDCAVIRDDGPGTVVRLYLGDAGLASWWGDDWDDAPYEHNAGTVYPEYVSGTVDIEFPAGYVVWEPCDDLLHLGNSPWSKQDMRAGVVPMFVAMPAGAYDPHRCVPAGGPHAEGLLLMRMGDMWDESALPGWARVIRMGRGQGD